MATAPRRDASSGSPTRRHRLVRFGLATLCAVMALVALPRPAAAWWNSDWAYRKEITIDGGAAGGAIASDTGRVPVLVRLHDGNFKFPDAKEDGTDLRFVADDDKTPLKFHIEKFDAVFDLGVVWVDLPELKAGAVSKIWMYYGNTKAATAEDAKGSYDGGQVLVYHFGEKDGPARDTTGYGNNASTASLPVNGSLIGSGTRFDGKTTVIIPASPSLSGADGASLTWSAWIKAETPTGILFARHDGEDALIIGLADGVPYVMVDRPGGVSQKSGPVAVLPQGQWHQLAVTAADKITLYVDGKPVQTLAATLPALTGNASLGGDDAASAGYTGELDELEISKVARPPGYLQAVFAASGPDGKLIHYGQDEQTSSWSSGYVGIILKSVTLDGWVIISILIVMALVSWIVMANRALYIRRVAKGNRAFVVAYDKTEQELTRLIALANVPDEDVVRDSPLFSVLEAGVHEIRLRLGKRDPATRGVILSAQTIEAMRASIDAVIVEEDQALNSMMVLLTIAIAGGPFIGLLGTVVGVMITFAAIAASGDVNVNAIAPGIAAALVATCAGLFVAIPALFGYNYLQSKIQNISAQIQVFTDRFITRVAEMYQTPPEFQDIAAE